MKMMKWMWVFAIMAGLGVSTARAQSLIISQYVETESGTTPKGIELWNAGETAIDFSVTPLDVQKGVNGNVPSSDFTLNSGTLAPGAVWVIGTSDVGTYLDNTFGVGTVNFSVKGFTFNGDDALVVLLGGVTNDVFGTVGVDPGTEWSGNGVSSANQNIGLLPGITSGDVDGWTDPSERFSTISTAPTGAGGLEGFGVAPAQGALPLTVSLSLSTGSTIPQGVEAVVSATALYGTEPYTYEWTSTLSVADYTVSSNQLTVLGTAPDGDYSVDVTVTDDNAASTNATLNFSVRTSHAITVTSNANGSISTLASAFAGTTVFVNTTPNTGFILTSIGVIGQDLTPITVTGNSFIMPDQPVIVSAVFEEFVFTGGELLISEVVDPSNDTAARYVELYNPTAEAVDLGAGLWHIVRQANGATGSVASAALSGTVQPTGTFTIAVSSSGFTTAYGFSPDQAAGILTGNGDDGYFLYHSGDATSGVLADIYGVPDVDGSGQDWEYTDSRAVRNASVTNASTIWVAAEWTISAAATTDATPGVHPEDEAPPPVDPTAQDIATFSISGGIASVSITNSEVGVSYVLTYSDTIGNTNPWILVDGPLDGSGADVGPFEDTAVTNALRFYRIEATIAP